MSNWDELASWWRDEVRSDFSYPETIFPMLDRLMVGTSGLTLDLGCGEGSGMRRVEASGRSHCVIGCDLSLDLVREARRTGPVVRCRLPSLDWIRADSIDVAYSVYVLDLIEDAGRFFAAIERIVVPGGSLVVIINHPAFTAPGSAPLLDDDGEVLWRWGRYFDAVPSPTVAGDRPIHLQHRPVSALLTAAAAAGWNLEVLEEHPLGAGFIERDPGYRGQELIPRFLGVRWSSASRSVVPVPK